MTPEQKKKEIERLRKIGRKGGRATKKVHGTEHFKKAGKKGGKSKWK